MEWEGIHSYHGVGRDSFYYHGVGRDSFSYHGVGRDSFYYEQQVKREVKRRQISVYRCNERLKAKTDGSKGLVYTGLCGDLEHLTIETRLINES
jgi:hypothetical protein